METFERLPYINYKEVVGVLLLLKDALRAELESKTNLTSSCIQHTHYFYKNTAKINESFAEVQKITYFVVEEL